MMIAPIKCSCPDTLGKLMNHLTKLNWHKRRTSQTTKPAQPLHFEASPVLHSDFQLSPGRCVPPV